MSTLDPSTHRLPAGPTDIRSLVGAVATAVRGAAFWATIPLPLVVAAALVSGAVAAAPLVVVGLVLLNVCCAALGHTYSPTR